MFWGRKFGYHLEEATLAPPNVGKHPMVWDPQCRVFSPFASGLSRDQWPGSIPDLWVQNIIGFLGEELLHILTIKIVQLLLSSHFLFIYILLNSLLTRWKNMVPKVVWNFWCPKNALEISRRLHLVFGLLARRFWTNRCCWPLSVPWRSGEPWKCRAWPIVSWRKGGGLEDYTVLVDVCLQNLHMYVFVWLRVVMFFIWCCFSSVFQVDEIWFKQLICVLTRSASC